MKNISTSIRPNRAQNSQDLHHLEDLLQLGVPPRLPPQAHHPERHLCPQRAQEGEEEEEEN